MNAILTGLLLGIGLSAAISAGVVLFAKFLPKEATFKTKIAPLAKNLARVVYLFMRRWLNVSDVDKVEEGFFKTIAYWLDGGIAVFMAELDIFITNDQNKKV